jgi:hypothetical protein
MSTRPRYVITLTAALVMLALPAALEAQQRVDIRRAVTSDVSVRVSGAYAKLDVVAWNVDSIALTGTLPKGARLEGGVGSTVGPARGAKFWIEPAAVHTGGGTLVLRVPANARVWVKTDNAVVSVDGVTGELDLNIVAGSIKVRGTLSQANLESMDGTVTFDGTASWLRIKTGDGNVMLRGSAEDLGITTVSGLVTVRDGNFERARIESVTGAVVFAGNLQRGAALTIDTHSGTIDLASRLKASMRVDARTLTGRIENTLTSKRPSPGRDGRGEELTLELGSGGAQATLRSFKAGIRLIADTK